MTTFESLTISFKVFSLVEMSGSFVGCLEIRELRLCLSFRQNATLDPWDGIISVEKENARRPPIIKFGHKWLQKHTFISTSSFPSVGIAWFCSQNNWQKHGTYNLLLNRWYLPINWNQKQEIKIKTHWVGPMVGIISLCVRGGDLPSSCRWFFNFTKAMLKL